MSSYNRHRMYHNRNDSELTADNKGNPDYIMKYILQVEAIVRALEDGWMTCDFTSLSIVCQPYQGKKRVIIKKDAGVQWDPVDGWKDFHLFRDSNPDHRSLAERVLLSLQYLFGL